jgi:hypothetical protein
MALNIVCAERASLLEGDGSKVWTMVTRHANNAVTTSRRRQAAHCADVQPVASHAFTRAVTVATGQPADQQHSGHGHGSAQDTVSTQLHTLRRTKTTDALVVRAAAVTHCDGIGRVCRDAREQRVAAATHRCRVARRQRRHCQQRRHATQRGGCALVNSSRHASSALRTGQG